MPAINYSDKIWHLGREYLLHTTINELRKAIVNSLFNDGRLLSSRSLPSPENMESQELMEYVGEIHRQYLADFNSLLGVVERMKDSGRPEIIIKLGITLYSRKLYDEALELLMTAVEYNPENSGLRILLGKSYMAKNLIEQAREEFIKAIQLASNYPDYRNLLGIAYLRSKMAAAAISEFKKAIELNVYYHKAYFNLGRGYILNGIVKEDFNLAKNLMQNCNEAFRKATMFNPGYLNQDYQQGIEFLNNGSLEDAYTLLGKVAEEETTDSSREKTTEMFLRYVRGEDGMTDAGIDKYIEEIKKLQKANPGYADLHNELGMAYTIMGKIIKDKAIDHFNQALRINPNFTRARKNVKLSENDLRGFEILLEAILK